jgi:hypothetical protein
LTTGCAARPKARGRDNEALRRRHQSVGGRPCRNKKPGSDEAGWVTVICSRASPAGRSNRLHSARWARVDCVGAIEPGVGSDLDRLYRIPPTGFVGHRRQTGRQSQNLTHRSGLVGRESSPAPARGENERMGRKAALATIRTARSIIPDSRGWRPSVAAAR